MPSVYGNDRIFAYLRLEEAPDAAQDTAVEALEKAGKPVITIRVATKYDLVEEFVRWEIATAIAGAVIGINPFNQPDVEASKIVTKSMTSEYEKTGKLPAETPFFEGERLKLFADAKNAEALKSTAGCSPSLSSFLKAHFARLGKGDYLALLAYVEMNTAHEVSFSVLAIVCAIRRASQPAWVLGLASCTPRVRLIRVVPLAACSFK